MFLLMLFVKNCHLIPQRISNHELVSDGVD